MIKKHFTFPKRTLHLDFHTSPYITDIGKDFDPDIFAQTFEDARVDSVTLFAMCIHGCLYYNTNHPARHPNLPKKLHLLEEQVEALHSKGIRAPIYLSVQFNEYAAAEHPEWIALDEELRQIKAGGTAFDAGYMIMDMSSPYRDYLTDILDEVLRKFKPVDGIFMDLCWDQISYSKWAFDGMRKHGYDPKNIDDRKLYSQMISQDYMKQYSDMFKTTQTGPFGMWFNSRPKTGLYKDAKYLSHIEIEALPTGDYWGYMYFPYVSRFVKPLALPTLSHTGRFFKGWGDISALKPEMALKYEVCQILSQGMTVGVGDFLHPYGKPDKAVYDLIGKVYSYVEKCEPYIEGTTPVSQIALVVETSLGDDPGPSVLGAVRALTGLKQQFDVIPASQDINGYELIIIPESTDVDDELRKKISNHINKDGTVILSGKSAFTEDGHPVLNEQSIESEGESPFSHTFLHVDPCISEGLEDYSFVMYEKGNRVKPLNKAEILIRIGEPFFERTYEHFSGHEYAPEKELTDYAAAVQNERVITFAIPLLEAYGKHAMPAYRKIFGNCIKRLIEPVVEIDGPSHISVTAVRNEKSTVLHFLSFIPERKTEGLDVVEDAIPVIDLAVTVKIPEKPARVFLAPEEKDLDFIYNKGVVKTSLSFYEGHTMLVITN